MDFLSCTIKRNRLRLRGRISGSMFSALNIIDGQRHVASTILPEHVTYKINEIKYCTK